MKKIPIIAANWKMYPPPPDALMMGSPYHSPSDANVVVFPTALHIETCRKAGLTIGGQHARPEVAGAFTGDLSMEMVKAAGCSYVLCGHSERRKNHGETDEDVAAQVVSALQYGLTPILCIGETAEDHIQGKAKEVLQRQLRTVLQSISKLKTNKRETKNFVIAYEPVWAISGGDGNKNACDPKTAQKMHAFIRSQLSEGMQATRIIYGGSMKPENAEELLKQPDIDGGLIGAASLDPQKFGAIVETAVKVFAKK